MSIAEDADDRSFLYNAVIRPEASAGLTGAAYGWPKSTAAQSTN